MKGLTKKIAMEIVRRTMQVIGYNVNVMDQYGRIIGSGDPKRVGQSHEGALLAIKRRGRFEIDEESAARLQGVLPGTNLVIEFQDEVVGVIGITGDPKEVTKYGELVKMTAEMYLEQMKLLEQAQWDKRMKENFLLSVVSSDESQAASLRHQAQQIGFKVDLPHVACIMELVDHSEDEAMTTLKRVADLLEGRPAISLIAIRNSQQVVLIKEKLHERMPHSDICEGIHQIRRWLDTKEISPMRIAVGQTFTGIQGMMTSFQSAEDAMRAGRAIYPEEPVYYASDMPMETFMARMDPSWMTEELLQRWDLFVEEDRSGELRQTLEVYYMENGEQRRIAEKLMIHRNTLRYRLQRITELTGKDPRHYQELFLLMSARWLYLLNQSR